MSGFANRLPRLTNLMAFEAAARRGSFTLSAREFNVTQSAISQQVHALEKELGARLFLRTNRGLEPTAEGRILQRAVADGFECIAAAVDELRSARRPSVTVGTTTAIASFWLVPRLREFRARHPDINVNIVAADLGFDAVADRIDAGIVFGRGAWPGFESALLREGDVFPVCSPDYLRGRPPLTCVGQLLGEMLLMFDNDRATVTNWREWFASQGVPYAPHRRTRFNTLSLLLQATSEGLGVALGWSLLTDDLLARGALVRPLPAVLRTEGSYFLVVARAQRPSPEVQLFRDWVLDHFPRAGQPVGRVMLPAEQG